MTLTAPQRRRWRREHRRNEPRCSRCGEELKGVPDPCPTCRLGVAQHRALMTAKLAEIRRQLEGLK